jgi:hypothetical protein
VLRTWPKSEHPEEEQLAKQLYEDFSRFAAAAKEAFSQNISPESGGTSPLHITMTPHTDKGDDAAGVY